MHKPYTDAQLKLLKVFFEQEHCTYPQIAELTGIPHGSLATLANKAETKSVHKQRAAKTHLARIKEARKIQRLRTKYAQELAEQFPQT